MPPFTTKLSGVEIANVRQQAARSTLPTWKRMKRYRQPLPHIGKKQQAKMGHPVS